MAKLRSPNYPFITLREAIDHIKVIYKTDMRNKMTREVLSRHLGYTGLNGRSQVLIAAIKSYGLLEGRHEEIRVSESAMDIIAEPEQSPVWQSRVKEAAFFPTVFAEINSHYEGERPSPENLRAFLIRKEFTPDAVNRIVKIYMDNFELVTQLDVGYNDKNEPEFQEYKANDSESNERSTAMKTEYLSDSRSQATASPLPFSANWTETSRLIEGEVFFKMPSPESLSPESLEDLEYWIQGVMRKVKRIAATKPKADKFDETTKALSDLV